MGLFAAAAFGTKYTFCGLYAGLAAAVLIIYLAGGRIRELLRLILCFLAGFLSLSALILLWYLLRGGLAALWNAYFIDNLTGYSQNIRGGNYPDPLPNLLNNLPWSIPLFLGLTGLLLQLRKQWREFLAVLLSSIGLFVFTYWSDRKYPYYALVMQYGLRGPGMDLLSVPPALISRAVCSLNEGGAASLKSRTAALADINKAIDTWSAKRLCARNSLRKRCCIFRCATQMKKVRHLLQHRIPFSDISEQTRYGICSSILYVLNFVSR